MMYIFSPDPTNPAALAQITQASPDITPEDLIAISIVVPAIVYDRTYPLRAALAVERARAWEARGLEWSGELSVIAAADEAALCWIVAIGYVLGAP